MTATTKQVFKELIEDIFITVNRNYERWPLFQASTKFGFTRTVTNMYMKLTVLEVQLFPTKVEKRIRI